LEVEIDEGDLSLCKNRGGRWAALVVALRGKGVGGSKLEVRGAMESEGASL
jgi:hypothetical protein